MAITGRPAAMASTSTPEVTWSRESYGSTTTAAEAMNVVSCAVSRYVVVERDGVADSAVRGLLRPASGGTGRRRVAKTFGWVTPATV